MKSILTTTILVFSALYASAHGIEGGASREVGPRFKGVELYSFADNNGNMKYALLSGTNRNKQEEELVANAITYKQLMSRVGKLAKDEYVFWFNSLSYRTKYIKLAYPSQETIRKIEKRCEVLGIRLHLPN